ncbi:hypothetical protein K8I61_00120 [bacterium]|nr:hypothetical protein [bacterium]
MSKSEGNGNGHAQDGLEPTLFLPNPAGDPALDPERREDQLDRLAQVGFAAGALIHDLSNVLGGMMGHVQLAQMAGDEATMKKAIDVVATGLGRARDQMARFKMFATRGHVIRLLRLSDELESLLDELARELARENVLVELVAPDVFVMADALLFHQLFAPLVAHVGASVGAGGRVQIVAKASDATHIAISIVAHPEKAGVSENAPLRDDEYRLLIGLAFEMQAQLERDDDGPLTAYRVILPAA